MIRRSHILGLALLALAFGQSVSFAQAATASAGFAVSIRVASVCEANGLCGAPTIHVVGTQAAPSTSSLSAIVMPLAPTADRDAGQRIDTRLSTGSVQIDF